MTCEALEHVRSCELVALVESSSSFLRDKEVPLLTPQRHNNVDDAGHNEVPRIIVVSDVRVYREGLALVLTVNGAVEVAGTSADYDGARQLVNGARPTVVLLDAGMPQALDLARQLLHAEPTVCIVGIAVNEDGADIVACAEAGLSGYVPRDGSIDDTITAIINATHDEVHCSPRIAAALFKHLSHPTTTSVSEAPALTPRELQVAQLVELGLSNKEIGHRLGISTATAKNHVHKLLEKLKVERRADVIARLREHRVTQRAVAAHRHPSSNETRPR